MWIKKYTDFMVYAYVGNPTNEKVLPDIRFRLKNSYFTEMNCGDVQWIRVFNKDWLEPEYLAHFNFYLKLRGIL